MNVLLIVNDALYGTENAYNAFRLAMALQKEHGDVGIRVFLMGDSVTCALPNQSTPQGYYNIERMLKGVIGKEGQIRACGTCSAARGIEELTLVEGVEISTMSQFAQWVVDSDRVLTF